MLTPNLPPLSLAAVLFPVRRFDVSDPEQLTGKISKSILLLQKGLEGPSYGLATAFAASVTGIVGGLTKDVPIALVTLSMAPLVAIAIVVLAGVMAVTTKNQNKAYAKAGGIATEALFAIKTVASLGLEPVFTKRYSSNLAEARQGSMSSAW